MASGDNGFTIWVVMLTAVLKFLTELLGLLVKLKNKSGGGFFRSLKMPRWFGEYLANADGALRKRPWVSGLLTFALTVSAATWLASQRVVANNTVLYYLLEAKECVNGKNFKGAQKLYEAALRIQPRNYYIHAKLGATLKSQGEWQKAIESYERAFDLNPQYLDALEGKGMCQFDKKDFDDAIQTLGDVLKRVKEEQGGENTGTAKYTYAKAHLRKLKGQGMIKCVGKDYDAAVNAYEQCNEGDDSNEWKTWCYYDQACFYSWCLREPGLSDERSGQFRDKAIELLGKAALYTDPKLPSEMMMIDEDLDLLRTQIREFASRVQEAKKRAEVEKRARAKAQ